jgi:hypothetical protein
VRILALFGFGALIYAANLGENAALRYWSAFGQMHDTTVTPEQAKELQAILAGVSPYSGMKYRELLERNHDAIKTLQRGTALPQCDWGIEYRLGAEAPVEYVRKGLVLGRLNILYAFHQLQTGNRAGGIQSLTMGIRFSRHLSEGGSLFAALAAKNLLVSHLLAVDFAAVEHPFSESEKTAIAATLKELSTDGIDWRSALKREFEVLERSGSPAPATLIDLYQTALQDNSHLKALEQALLKAPKPVADRIPSPKRVFAQRMELLEQLQRSRRMLVR